MLTQRKNRLKISFKETKHVAILVTCLLFLNYLTSAQILSDTSKLNLSENKTSQKDSIANTIPFSKDKLEFKVNYESKDSIVYYAKKKFLELHNTAKISYDNIKIESDYIIYEQDSSLLHALEIDSLNSTNDTLVGNSSRITQGEESSTFSALFYNFKSKRALIENAYSQYGEGFILSQQVKRNNDNSINGYKNIYTTCNNPHPHFGIATKKIKIIPNKVAVAGSANLIIEDIPTPLYLPFGLFPLKQGQRSGFKLPTYSMGQQLGFGLREGGYYFAINEHMDLLALADIYALGSWRVGFINKYSYKYRFNGGFSFDYAYNKIGESYEPGNQNNRTFFLRWNHTIDPQLLQGSTFSANVNFGSSKFQRNNSLDANLFLQNTYISNISYSKSWKNKPYNLAVALRHTQNTGTGLVQVTLPEINFTVNQFFPFQLRKNIIKPRWYERINASYRVAAINRLDFYDSVFSINNLNSNDFQNGMKHEIPINASYNILKFINLSLSANYNEYWYTKKYYKEYNFSELKLDTAIQNGFFTARDFSTNASFSTRIYGIKLFKKGAIRGIRHVLTPNINLNYRPDFGTSSYNYYYNSFVDRNFTSQKLSYFDGSIYGGPPNGKVGGVGFNLGNTLSMKVKDSKDTLNGVRTVNLIDGLNISSFYNMAVDSFNWSNVAVSFRSTLFETINMSGGMSYSPYAQDKTNGRRLPDYNYNINKKLLRFETANLALTASLPFKKRSALNTTQEQKASIGNNTSAYADFSIPWNLSLNYSINFNKNLDILKQKDTIAVSQNINFFGDVNLTQNWKVGFRSGYDFQLKKISYSSFDIYRDLHCWEMRLNLIPFGITRSFNFSLNVKASVLQDLKLVRRKDFRDFL